MNQIYIGYTRYPDGCVSGIEAAGLTDSQLRYYALESGFNIVGNSQISTVVTGSHRNIECLLFMLEMYGYDVSGQAYDVVWKETA